MITRRDIISLLLVLLPLLGLSACTTAPEPQLTPVFVNVYSTPPGTILPRLTPHVTSPAPTKPVVTITIAPKPIPQIVPESTPTATAPPVLVVPTPTPQSLYTIHTVRPGETLYDIAQQYQVPLSTLAEFNGITDPTSIHAGDIIHIPPLAP